MICGVEGSAVRRTYPTYAVRLAQVLYPFTLYWTRPGQSQNLKRLRASSPTLENHKGGAAVFRNRSRKVKTEGWASPPHLGFGREKSKPKDGPAPQPSQ